MITQNNDCNILVLEDCLRRRTLVLTDPVAEHLSQGMMPTPVAAPRNSRVSDFYSLRFQGLSFQGFRFQGLIFQGLHFMVSESRVAGFRVSIPWSLILGSHISGSPFYGLRFQGLGGQMRGDAHTVHMSAATPVTALCCAHAARQKPDRCKCHKLIRSPDTVAMGINREAGVPAPIQASTALPRYPVAAIEGLQTCHVVQHATLRSTLRPKTS